MQQYLGLIYAVAAYVFWGIVPVFWKQLDEYPAAEIVSHRVVWGFVIVTLLIIALGQGRQLLSIVKQPKILSKLMLSASFVFVNWSIFIWAVNAGHLLETSLGYFINPLMTVVLGLVLFGERLRYWQSVALMIALGGVLVFVFAVGEFPWIALSLASTFAIYGVIKKTVDVPAAHGMSIETLMFVLPTLAYILYLTSQDQSHFSVSNWADSSLFILGGLFTLIPLALFSAAAKRESMITIGMIQYIGPILHFSIAVFYYHEPLGNVRLSGYALIWLALVIYSIDLIKNHRKSRSARQLSSL